MGRKAIQDQAMTNAERQRRYRQMQKSKSRVDNVKSTDSESLNEEIETIKEYKEIFGKQIDELHNHRDNLMYALSFVCATGGKIEYEDGNKGLDYPGLLLSGFHEGIKYAILVDDLFNDLSHPIRLHSHDGKGNYEYMKSISLGEIEPLIMNQVNHYLENGTYRCNEDEEDDPTE